jgi:ATP-dependent DNA helicase PIF1
LKHYEEWLLKLGEGRLPSVANVDNSSIIEIPSEMCVESMEECVDSVFDDFEVNIGNADYFKSRILLAATNEIVNEINDKMVKRIPGDIHEFASVDTVVDTDSSTMFPTEFLNSLSLSGLPEHLLKLKIDTVVILLRNMDIQGGHCNGTRYLVKHIGKYRLVLEKLDCKDDDRNKTLILPRIPTRYGGQSFPFELTRLQFPIKIAFALTINRAQGQSAKRCGILLPKNIWTHGQIYVAFSRCGNPDNIFVWAEQSQFEEYGLDKSKKYVKNVVYREVI